MLPSWQPATTFAKGWWSGVERRHFCRRWRGDFPVPPLPPTGAAIFPVAGPIFLSHNVDRGQAGVPPTAAISEPATTSRRSRGRRLESRRSTRELSCPLLLRQERRSFQSPVRSSCLTTLTVVQAGVPPAAAISEPATTSRRSRGRRQESRRSTRGPSCPLLLRQERRSFQSPVRSSCLATLTLVGQVFHQQRQSPNRRLQVAAPRVGGRKAAAPLGDLPVPSSSDRSGDLSSRRSGLPVSQR